VSQQPRNNTWLQAANLLFLDQPVGTGYSYVDNPAPGGQLTTNNTQIANDVVTLLRAFTAAFPATETAPFWIMTESYGGKMGSAVALAILAAVDAGSLTLNFKGVGIGDSWISGVSYVDAWGPYLYNLQVFDDRDLAECASRRAAAPAPARPGRGQAAADRSPPKKIPAALPFRPLRAYLPLPAARACPTPQTRSRPTSATPPWRRGTGPRRSTSGAPRRV